MNKENLPYKTYRDACVNVLELLLQQQSIKLCSRCQMRIKSHF